MAIDAEEPDRRDFLVLAASAFVAVGGAVTLWPFVQQMNPDAGALALASIEVDIAPVEGRSGDHRAVARQAGLHPPSHGRRDRGRQAPCRSTDLVDEFARNDALPDDAPATDPNRTASGHENWLIMVGICTHLGCIPKGQSLATARATSAAGSAPATARTTTRPDASVRDRRRAISRCRSTIS